MSLARTDSRPTADRGLEDAPPTIQRGGWLFDAPLAAFLASLGLALIATADSASRSGQASAEIGFWGGLILIYLPALVLLLSTSLGRGARLSLLATVGLSCYLVKVMQSPTWFAFYDENLHLRTAEDILSTHHLYAHNPLLPISPFYPGLEIVTDALARVTGLGLFPSGLVVIGASRLLLMLALFLLVEGVTSSARLAGLAGMVYAGNPAFLFFDAQFAYESLAAALAIFTLLAIYWQLRRPSWWLWRFTPVPLLGVVALTLTHHLTSYLFLVLLASWVVAALFVRRQRSDASELRGLVVLTGVLIIAWIVYVASITVQYVGPGVLHAASSAINLIGFGAQPRELFHAQGGEVTPLWERGTILLGTSALLLGAFFGAVSILRRQRYNVFLTGFAVASLLYPLAIGLRFVWGGVEASFRLSGMTFIPLSVVAVVAIDQAARKWSGRRAVVDATVVVFMSMIFLSGAVQSVAPEARLPGPYLAAADARSVELEGVDAARWARQNLGPNNRVAADRTNRFLMGGVGHQDVVTSEESGVWLPSLFYATSVDRPIAALIHKWGVEYVVMDLRFGKYAPVRGGYIEGADDLDGTRVRPGTMSRATLHKFDRAMCASREFDSGHILLYAVGKISGCRAVARSSGAP